MIHANPGQIALAVFSIAIMSCGETDCPVRASSFQIVLDRAEWTPADYAIEVDYERDGILQKRICRVRVPWLEVVGDEADGGSMLVDLDSAMEDFHRSKASLMSCDFARVRDLTMGAAFVAVGRAIVVTVYDNPSHVDLVVRDAGEAVLERELRLDYEIVSPAELGCAVQQNAVARVTLP